MLVDDTMKAASSVTQHHRQGITQNMRRIASRARASRLVVSNTSHSRQLTGSSNSSSPPKARNMPAVALAVTLGAAMCPLAAFAHDSMPSAPAQGYSAQQEVIVIMKGSNNNSSRASPSWPAPEAPALVSDSSDLLLDGVKGVVAEGLQDLAATHMTAIGGPVTGEAVSAATAPSSSNNPTQAAEGLPGAAAPQQATAAEQQLASPPHRYPWCGLWVAYCHALETSPLLTKAYTGMVGTLIGDMTAQVLSYHSANKNNKAISSSSGSASGFKFDAMRCARLSLFSAIVGTPMGHYWYQVLESTVMPNNPTSPIAVVLKVCLDQLVQTPFGMALFFSLMKVLEGHPQAVQQELKAKLMPGLLANWKLWPAAQLINFMVIPPEQRILFGNVVGICWIVIISNMQQDSGAANDNSSVGNQNASSPDINIAAKQVVAETVPFPTSPGKAVPA